MEFCSYTTNEHNPNYDWDNPAFNFQVPDFDSSTAHEVSSTNCEQYPGEHSLLAGLSSNNLNFDVTMEDLDDPVANVLKELPKESFEINQDYLEEEPIKENPMYSNEYSKIDFSNNIKFNKYPRALNSTFPSLTRDRLSTGTESLRQADKRPEQQSRSKNGKFSKMCCSGITSKRNKNLKKFNPFTNEDYFYNSFYLAKETLESNNVPRNREQSPEYMWEFQETKPRKIPYWGRRKLTRLIKQAQRAEKTLMLHSSYFSGVNESNRDQSRIVDSGTSKHMARDKSDFECIFYDRPITIKGATGKGRGYEGLLKNSKLGNRIPGIWFEQLPVKMLLSTQGLGRDGWKTVFYEDNDGKSYIRDRRTGKNIDMTLSNGLWCVDVTFGVNDGYEKGYTTQSVENCGEWFKECHYCPEVAEEFHNSEEEFQEIPKNLQEAITDTLISNKRKRARESTSMNNKQRKKVIQALPKARSKISKLLAHQRFCHMFTGASMRCKCYDCLEMKGRRASCDSVRPKRMNIDQPFLLFSCDFFGKVKPVSFRNNSYVLVFVDDTTGYTKCVPIQNKSDAPHTLVKVVKEIRSKCGVLPDQKANSKGGIIFGGIHSDNEPVLRGETWRSALQRSGLQELHSVPYKPQMNGTCERMVGTVKSALRASMNGVDPRLWDFCAAHISKLWNIKISEKATKYSKTGAPACPEDIMEQVSENPLMRSGIAKLKWLRRFGCLVYFKRDVSPEGVDHLKNNALSPRRARGVHLGFSEKNSSWLIGSMNREGRFCVFESVDCVFVESILVRDLVGLCAWRASLPVVETTETDLRQYPLLDRKSPSAGGSAKPAGESDQVRLLGDHCPTETKVAHPDLLEQVTVNRSRTQQSRETHRGVSNEEFSDDDNELIIESDIENVHETTEAIPNTGVQGGLIPTVPVSTQVPKAQESKADPGDEDLLERGTRLKDEYNFPIQPLAPPEQPKSITEASSGPIFGPTTKERGKPKERPPKEKRRRGRPAGIKDTKKRVRRTKKAVEDAKLEQAFWSVEDTEFSRLTNEMIPEEFSHLTQFDDDEELETTEFEIFLAVHPQDDSEDQQVRRNKDLQDRFAPSKPGDSVKPGWAFREGNPERPMWVEAKTKEECRLCSYETWRKLSREEERRWQTGKLKAVPCALLLNRKRCGRFKARLVVLGNRWHPEEENSVYASVVSQTGNRAVMTHCAREGFSIIPFDISNAFVRAEMGDVEVAITLPQNFRTDKDDNGRRMLKKALYGLPISPRLWAKRLARDLASKGWEECKSEPGVYRKWDKSHKNVVAYITVYVDDCILGAKTQEMCDAEVDVIHQMHPLNRIVTKVDDKGTQHFDMCGADIEYNSELHTLRITMSNYIDKIIKRFDLGESLKTRSTPGFPEKNLYNTDSKPCDFKFKAAVGALQWLATTARPDIAHSTNMLARAGAQPVTKAMAACAKLIFRYLKGTREVGLQYSKKIEADFQQVYENLAQHEDNKKQPIEQIREAVQLFTDASFGVAYKTLRSITGVTVYLHGMPIAWKTKVQTIHTSSTTESEWVAAADGIEFSQSVYGLQRFLVGRPELEENKGAVLVDNRPAVINARRGPEGIDEIPKKTRHIALRHARVLEHGKRIWFVPTDLQLADGMTKSIHRNPLLQIFTRIPEYAPVDPNEDAEEDQIDFSDSFLCSIKPPSNRSYARRDAQSFMCVLGWMKA